MTRVLDCHPLAFAFGGRAVLRGVALALAPGEVVGLVGPNGAGKTTWLRCLAGLLPTAGEIAYQGTPLTALSTRERSRRRAYVPQVGAVAFPYRVREVVAMGLAHRQRFFAPPRQAAVIDETLTALGFAPSPEQQFAALSGGEQQQVLLARALVQRAPLVLLDEPTSALDLRHRAALIVALRAAAAGGAGVLLSSHDLNLAALACDRLVLLADGQVQATGSPAEVLTSERLSATYQVPVVVAEHPVVGAPAVQLDPRGWR